LDGLDWIGLRLSVCVCGGGWGGGGGGGGGGGALGMIEWHKIKLEHLSFIYNIYKIFDFNHNQ